MAEELRRDAPELPERRSQLSRVRSARTLVAVAVTAIALVAVVTVLLYTRGGGPVPRALAFLSPSSGELLAASGPQEKVLRTLRLVGIERAAVGQEGDTAVVRLEIPEPSSAADVEIAWHSGIAALAQAYPEAGEYVVQLFVGDVAVAEIVGGDGASVRDALAADDGFLLRSLVAVSLLAEEGGADALSLREAPARAPGVTEIAAPDGQPSAEPLSLFGYVMQGLRGGPAAAQLALPVSEIDAAKRALDARPARARPLPAGSVAVDVHAAAAYLAAKNRAAGLLVLLETDRAADAAPIAREAAEMRAAALRTFVPAGDVGPAELHIARIRAAFASGGHTLGDAPILLGQLDTVGPTPDREQIAALRSWASAVEALTAAEPLGSVLGPVAGLAAQVADREVPQEGPLADAVLVAADSVRAPQSALAVSGFERAADRDVTPVRGMPDASLPGRVLALHGTTAQPPALAWASPSGVRSVAPDVWLAYRRADGVLFWLAGDGEDVALTDGSVRGWAFSRERAALVDANRSGRVAAYFRAQ